MDLNTFWFLLIALLWVGYFILEGFDFGVGVLLRLVGRDERGRRVLINTIGPVWDGNEVWVITAAGATFAAFPQWYATLLSGFYLPMLVILVSLILRGVAFEYRAKGDTTRWRAGWDKVIITTSILSCLLWGIVFGNIISGVPLDPDHEFIGSVGSLFNPFSVLMGCTTLALFTAHGAMFLALKTTIEVRERARRVALSAGGIAVVLLAGVLAWRQVRAVDVATVEMGVVSVCAGIAACWLTRLGRDGWSFTLSATATLAFVSSWFVGLFPNVMPSTLTAGSGLDIYNASSSAYTLTTMSWIALCCLPFVLAYQGWTYWVFRKRIGSRQIPMPADTSATGEAIPR